MILCFLKTKAVSLIFTFDVFFFHPQFTQVDFGEVCFQESQVQFLDVANTGQVNTEFQFANKLDDKHYCKPFLKVEPSSVFLMPGKFLWGIYNVIVNLFLVRSQLGVFPP